MADLSLLKIPRFALFRGVLFDLESIDDGKERIVAISGKRVGRRNLTVPHNRIGLTRRVLPSLANPLPHNRIRPITTSFAGDAPDLHFLGSDVVADPCSQPSPLERFQRRDFGESPRAPTWFAAIMEPEKRPDR